MWVCPAGGTVAIPWCRFKKVQESGHISTQGGMHAGPLGMRAARRPNLAHSNQKLHDKRVEEKERTPAAKALKCMDGSATHADF